MQKNLIAGMRKGRYIRPFFADYFRKTGYTWPIKPNTFTPSNNPIPIPGNGMQYNSKMACSPYLQAAVSLRSAVTTAVRPRT